MSKLKRHLVACACGQTFDADVYGSANVTTQPQLKDEILAGRFNRVACPACGRQFNAEIPFLYHDMGAGLMVWVYPASRTDQAAIREKVRRSAEIVASTLPDLTGTPSRGVVFGLDELIRLLTP